MLRTHPHALSLSARVAQACTELIDSTLASLGAAEPSELNKKASATDPKAHPKADPKARRSVRAEAEAAVWEVGVRQLLACYEARIQPQAIIRQLGRCVQVRAAASS